MTASFWAFLGISVLVIASPGPDTALTIRNTLMGGRRAGIATALGVATGQVIWAAMTAIGLVALLLASETLFQIVKLAGAAYLVVIGLQSLVAAWRGGAAGLPTDIVRRRLGATAGFRQGVINDLGNPKMAVFFASVLPQFAPAGAGMTSGLVALGLVFAAMTFLWLAAYAALIARAGRLFQRPGVRRALDAVTGATLVALGLRIAAAER